MRKYRLYLLVVMVTVSLFTNAGVAQAIFLPNGDFSSGLAGWETSDGAIVTNFASIPDEYTTRWDLSSWNTVMDGNFALLSNEHHLLERTIALLPGESPTTISLDYAIAWNYDAIPGEPHPYGYFYLETFGNALGVGRRSLSFDEIQWYVLDPTIAGQDVFTGSMTAGMIQHPGLVFSDITMHIYAFAPNGSLDHIVGIDNVSMVAAPVPDPGAAPVPEPSTILLIGFGLTGYAALSRRRRTN